MPAKIEYIVLKHILTSKPAAIEIISTVEKPEILFSKDLYSFTQLIFNYIRAVREYPTLRVLLDRSPKEIRPHIEASYNATMEVTIDPIEFKHDLSMLKLSFQKLSLLEIRKFIDSQPDVDPEKSLKMIYTVTQQIESVNREALYFQQNADGYVQTYREAFAERKEQLKNNIVPDDRIPLHFTAFDQATNGGLGRNADFLLVMGETGTGKSICCASMGKNIWLNGNKISEVLKTGEMKKGNNVLYVSCEMPYKQVWNRFIGSITEREYFDIDAFRLKDSDLPVLRDTFQFMEKVYPYKYKIMDFYGKPLSANILDQELERFKNEEGFVPDIIIIDYLGLMVENHKSNEADWKQIDTVTKEVRAVLRKRIVSAISPWQVLPMDGAKYTPEHAIGLHRMNRSKGASQHVTHVIQLVSRGATKEGLYSDIDYAILKVRDGFTAMGKMKKKFKCGLMEDDPSVQATQTTFPDIVMETDYASMDKISEMLG